MKTLDINSLIRENIRNLVPYSSARGEYTGNEAVFLDANENPNNTSYNRYPDPIQWSVKQKISELKGVVPERIFLGNGSDEAIDLLIRTFCQPGKDNILSVDPTYGMYKVCADISQVEYNQVLLTTDFQLDVELLLKQVNSSTKLLFLCSPNNPTSNSLKRDDILEVLNKFNGLVVLDEAYIDFSRQESLLPALRKYENLVILQTFSKAWGLAGIRLGMCFADERVISVMSKIKYPYNVNNPTLRIAYESLNTFNQKNSWVDEIINERNRLKEEFEKLPEILKVYPSDANFLLVKVKSPQSLFKYLADKKIIVRDRSKASLCEGCLRITVGTKAENDLLLKALKEIR